MYGSATDIHESRLRLEALRESEARLRILADAVPHIVWSNSADGFANYFNERWYRYSGLSEAASMGHGWEAIVHPDDAPLSKSQWREALLTGEVFDTEYRLRRFDGEYRWFIGRNVPLHDESGKVVGWFGSATDIQDMRTATEALRASEGRLRATMDTALDYAIINTDTSGLVLSWSKGAEHIFQRTESEMLHETADVIFTPEDRAAGAPDGERTTAMSEGAALDERWHIRKDGSRFYMSGVMRPVYDGMKLQGFLKVARDLTDRQEAAEAMRISEERYRAALQSADMAAWDWDVLADEVVWNDQHFLILGIAPDDKPRKAAFFLSFVHPGDTEQVTAALVNAAGHTGVYQAEFRIVRADNHQVRWMSGYGRAVVQDENGRAKRMVGVMYDITERKRLEHQKDEFIGVASHELKTPVTSMKAYAELIQERLEELGNRYDSDMLSKLNKQIDKLTKLINTLLDTTKISEGQLRFEPEEVDLNELIKERVEEIQRTTSHTFKLQTGDGKNVYADRERIGQVITNLLANAIKYSPKETIITVTSRVEDQAIKVSIKDEGPGIPEADVTRIFERFYRVTANNMDAHTGLGLGLYISAQIIQKHGGSFSVQSKVGEGSIFSFTIPLYRVSPGVNKQTM
ncbi:PAS domain-containing protein [Chitinophaga horti]|uniref:histidine kinase n=1 Tax=Chitinophaga horti TaxID=2920382 RepID=A0ABY6JBD8_9BACT|nr:PAS domain-containing sensor histidine kinase [Chitinophaga horti]UYQ95606.1 PAS domain-containing protein [Chitinophaga horti]